MRLFKNPVVDLASSTRNMHSLLRGSSLFGKRATSEPPLAGTPHGTLALKGIRQADRAGSGVDGQPCDRTYQPCEQGAATFRTSLADGRHRSALLAFRSIVLNLSTP